MVKQVQVTAMTTLAALMITASAWAGPGDVQTGVFTEGGASFRIESSPASAPANKGYTVNKIYFDTGAGALWSVGSIWVNPGPGTILQVVGPAPNPWTPGMAPTLDGPVQALVDFMPEMGDDTWVSDGNNEDNSPASDGGGASHTFPNNKFGAGEGVTASFSDSLLNQTWFDNPLANGGELLLAQVTIASSVDDGDWELAMFSEGASGGSVTIGGLGIRGGRLVTEAVIIPLPAAGWMGIGLMGALGVARLIRRKKS